MEVIARDRILGCLLGGAAGDALGAPVEFMSLPHIRTSYGERGIQNYASEYGRPGAITDDTQMTLFTLEGLLRGKMRAMDRGLCNLPDVVRRAYQRWLWTQGERCEFGYEFGHTETLNGWLWEQKVLHSRRAPGNSCLSALRSSRIGSIDEPINDSKGCGGVMRMAPVGFFQGLDWFRCGCELASLTHGHPSGYLSAGFLAHLVGELLNGRDLPEAVAAAREQLVQWKRHDECLSAVDSAVELAAAQEASAEAVETLGQGWVAEEALAISLYCALQAESFAQGVRLAVNHSGDSDSTGAITGNILGAMWGRGCIGQEFLEQLEVRDIIEEMAEDTVRAEEGQELYDKYPPY